MYSELIHIVAPVMLTVLVGYLWSKSPVPYATDFVTRLVTGIGAPCLILSSLNDRQLSLGEFLNIWGLAAAVLVLTVLLGLAVIRAMGRSATALLPCVVFPNTGNMGLPLCLLAFGQQGLAYGLVLFTFYVVLQLGSGMVFQVRAKGLAARTGYLLRQPLLYAVIVYIALIGMESRLPSPLFETADLIGGLAIPLMLITLGVSLGSLKSGDWHTALILSVTRIGGGLAAALAVVKLTGTGGLAADVLILQSAMPVAVMNYLFAVNHDREPGAVAGTVILSTLLSFLTIPLILTQLL